MIVSEGREGPHEQLWAAYGRRDVFDDEDLSPEQLDLEGEPAGCTCLCYVQPGGKWCVRVVVPL